jgi:hypothetical protein
MSLIYIQFVLVFLISYNCVFGLIKLPICQCECCPGELCQSQLLVFSVDKCNETTCSFEQCYNMYPKKCGLIPGTTNSSCDGINKTTNSSRNIIVQSPNATSSNIIFPIVVLLNILFCFLSTF